MEIETVPITDVLISHSPDTVKNGPQEVQADSPTAQMCEVLRRLRWLIEVHGPEILLNIKLQGTDLSMRSS